MYEGSESAEGMRHVRELRLSKRRCSEIRTRRRDIDMDEAVGPSWATNAGPTTPNAAAARSLAPQSASSRYRKQMKSGGVWLLLRARHAVTGRPKRSLSEGERRPRRLKVGTQR